MSSPLLLTQTPSQQEDYLAVVVITAVVYDYVLTFSEEIEYIWRKPWTWVSTLYILVRYCGLYSVVTFMLLESSSIPGLTEVYVFVLPSVSGLPNTTDIGEHTHSTASPVYSANGCFQGEIVDVISLWTFILFLGAADFVMVLRVWAMYNRSRLILGTLLTLFSLETIATILSVASVNVSGILLEPIVQVATVLRLTHGAVMCMFAIVQFVRQSCQMYRVTKQWYLNRYMNLLVKEGIFYFFAILLFNLIDVLTYAEEVPVETWQIIMLVFAEYVPMYTLTPRFITSMRELYARDVQGKCGGEIDTAFGLSLSVRDTGGTAVVFADVGQTEGLEVVEEIPMEVMEIGSTESS